MILNSIYKHGYNLENNQYIVFPKWYIGLDGYINNRTDEESLELQQLKLVVTGFDKPSHLTKKLSVEGKVKQVLKFFIKKLILVNKVIENNYLYYGNDFKYIYFNYIYYKIFKKSDNRLFKILNKIRKRRFEIFISNRNRKQDHFIFLLKNLYRRLVLKFNINYNLFLHYSNIRSNILEFLQLNVFVFAVQIYDKMIKLITKIVKTNSKYFFLNNIKYNYTLLKFCDKSMKIVNSILLFCLLCDINIPYYCFHSDLSIAGNCRMCLVQLDTSLKPIASCAVSIGINSTIYTNTKIIQKAREGVLEFLLINHPLDCPICDQGGECDLQEQFITYGNDRGRFSKKMI